MFRRGKFFLEIMMRELIIIFVIIYLTPEAVTKYEGRGKCYGNKGKCVSHITSHMKCFSRLLGCSKGKVCCTFSTKKNTKKKKKLKKNDTKTCGGMHVGCRFRGGDSIPKSKKRKSCRDGTTIDSLVDKKSCSCCVKKGICRCGLINKKRIVGGEEVHPKNKYPWHVGLKDNIISEYFCGGTLINDRYVLSAAHCLYSPMTGNIFKPQNIKIALADHNQFSTDEDVPGVTGLVDTESIIVHENYKIEELEHDIGMIRLKKSIDFSVSNAVQPACLPLDSVDSYRGRLGIIMGWGYSDEIGGLFQDVLLETRVNILGPKCPGKLPVSLDITKGMLCAGTNSGGKDSCSGDSGGGLFINDKGKYILVGITSYGIGCGIAKTPGIYTRITEYLNWIMKHSKDAHYCS